MVRVADIKSGNLCLKGALMVSEAVFKLFTKNYEPKRNDIVLSRVGSYGISSFVETDELFCMGQNTVVLQSNVPPRFLYYALNSQSICRQIEDGSYGSGYKSLSLRNIKELRLSFPPAKTEQEAIATALSDVDALLGAMDRLIAKKRDLKQAAMQELLTGKRRLPGFSGKWEEKKIGEVLKIMHGKNQRAVEDRSGSYPILGTGGQIGTANGFLYDKPSVLIGRKGSINKTQYMDTPFWSVDTLFYSVVQEPNNPKYLFYQFCLIDWMQYNEASGVPSLNARTIESVSLSFPVGAEQTAIATVLSDMDAELTALEQRRDKTRALKQAMMQELLTGRTRIL